MHVRQEADALPQRAWPGCGGLAPLNTLSIIDDRSYEVTFAVVLNTGACILQRQVGGICKHSLHAVTHVDTEGKRKSWNTNSGPFCKCGPRTWSADTRKRRSATGREASGASAACSSLAAALAQSATRKAVTSLESIIAPFRSASQMYS